MGLASSGAWQLSDWSTLMLEGPSIPPGEAAVSIESSTGEMGFYLVSDGGSLLEILFARARCAYRARP